MAFAFRSLLFCLLVVSGFASAQEVPGTPEFDARHNPNSPYNVLNGDDQQPAAPPVQWADRWGAIARDPEGEFGIVTDLPNERIAQSSAISECKNRGGAGCSISLAFRNQCAAVISSPSETFSQGAAYEGQAIDIAMKDCKASNSGECRVYWSGCSLPVRAQ